MKIFCKIYFLISEILYIFFVYKNSNTRLYAFKLSNNIIPHKWNKWVEKNLC